jgi:sugar lactone lactonase YvrE
MKFDPFGTSGPTIEAEGLDHPAPSEDTHTELSISGSSPMRPCSIRSSCGLPRPMSEVVAIGSVRAELGEGPCWDERAQVLRFVDIVGRRVYRYDPGSAATTWVDVAQEVGAVVVCRDGGLLVALRDGIARLDEDTAAVELIAPIDADRPSMRMNDAKCDTRGRLWAGTMAFDATPRAGALYRFDGRGAPAKVMVGVTISNGLDWSADDRAMYYVDSMEGVDVFKFDAGSGRLADRRRLVSVEPELGIPDGMTVDAEGFLWVAIWGGSCVRRYSPDGELNRVLPMPVSQVTSVAFGGVDYSELFVTTARVGLTTAQLEDEPLAGALFVCRPGVRGRPANRFGAQEAVEAPLTKP